MAAFAVTNWTKRGTHGTYPDQARPALDALPRVLEPGDDYDVWRMLEGSPGVGDGRRGWCLGVARR